MIINEEEIQNSVINRNERRKLETKEKVRQASLKTFLELGYLKATVQDIMIRADLGYGTFYKHYSSKRDVILELANEAWEMMTKNYANKLPMERRIFYLALHSIHNILQTFAKHREVMLILRDCHIVDDEINKIWLKLSGEPIERLKRDLTWSIKRGLCAEMDFEITLLAFKGIIQSTGNYVMENNLPEEEIMKISENVARIFEKAIYTVKEIPIELMPSDYEQDAND